MDEEGSPGPQSWAPTVSSLPPVDPFVVVVVIIVVVVVVVR